MLLISGLSKAINEKILFEDVNLTATPGDRIALIGDNGSGKTTLLKLIADEMKPDNGAIKITDVISVVEQENNFSGTISEYFSNDESWQVDLALETVGLTKIDPNQLITNLSGGQKTRLSIAKILATEYTPEILLLDEPTNNLDADGLVWLEQFLQKFHGTVIFVSHDRAFIDKIATKIWLITDQTVRTFTGNYTDYKTQIEAERQRAEFEYQKSQDEKRKTERLLKIAEQRARTGIRRKKPTDNDKSQFDWHNDTVQKSLGSRTKALHTRLDKLDGTTKPPVQKLYRANLQSTPTHNKVILRLENVSKQFGDRTILSDVDLEIRANSRIRISGTNGSGKTTLLNIAAERLAPDDGTVWRAPNLRIGYMSQEVIDLDFVKSGLSNLLTIFDDTTAIFKAAAVMDLVSSDLSKPVNQLSRGQQAKLGILKLLLGRYDLIILDEPTNHLDIRARENIEQALEAYTGAILLASHDQYFVKQMKIGKEIVL